MAMFRCVANTQPCIPVLHIACLEFEVEGRGLLNVSSYSSTANVAYANALLKKTHAPNAAFGKWIHAAVPQWLIEISAAVVVPE